MCGLSNQTSFNFLLEYGLCFYRTVKEIESNYLQNLALMRHKARRNSLFLKKKKKKKKKKGMMGMTSTMLLSTKNKFMELDVWSYILQG